MPEYRNISFPLFLIEMVSCIESTVETIPFEKNLCSQRFGREKMKHEVYRLADNAVVAGAVKCARGERIMPL